MTTSATSLKWAGDNNRAHTRGFGRRHVIDPGYKDLGNLGV
jgi:hypothetical protein